MADDTSLLNRWATSRDASAFSELACRHAGLVYGTCRRIVHDHHLAEEVAQECLFELARKASSVRESVAGFLHATATSRSKNRVRSETARVRREGEVPRSELTALEQREPTWVEIAPQVDQALAELPDELRLPLVMHFLSGRSQVQVAEELHCDQATVSRHIGRGIELLRKRLGSTLSVLAFSLLLSTNAHAAAPPTLLISAAKIAMSGGGASAAGGATAVAAVSISKLLVTGMAAMLLALGGWLGWRWSRPSSQVAAARLVANHVIPTPVGAVIISPPVLERRIEAGDPSGFVWKGALGPGPVPTDGRICLAAERFADEVSDVMDVYIRDPSDGVLWTYQPDLILRFDLYLAYETSQVELFTARGDGATFMMAIPATVSRGRWTNVTLRLAELKVEGSQSLLNNGDQFKNLVFAAHYPRGDFWIDNLLIVSGTEPTP